MPTRRSARGRDVAIDIKVGQKIRLRRIELKLSQEQLGKKLGLTFQQIQKYERGANSVAATRLPLLCQVLGLSPNDLLSDSGPFPKTELYEGQPLSTFAISLAVRVDRLPSAHRRSVSKHVFELEKRNGLI